MKTLSSIKKAYFLGIGGVSMSSLAMILMSKGVEVSGYDMKQSATTDMLIKAGIKVDFVHSEEAFDGVDTLVFSAAIKETNPGYALCLERGIDILSRAELLGLITGDYPHAIGIAGTHGKSTTTGMLSKICLDFDEETAVLSGANLPFLGGLFKGGSGERIVFEACEYKNSYHSMFPTIKVILNCEHDHVDFFPTISDVIASFRKYIDTAREGSSENIAVVNLDCPNSVEAAKGTSAEVYYFSLKEKTDFYAESIDLEDGYGKFDLVLRGERINGIKLSVPGIHNIDDAVAAASAAYLCGVDLRSIKKGLESFTGVSRRFEKLGERDGVTFIDDYAHHPDEINVTLTAAKALPFKRVLCVFQPHTYTRTRALLTDFAKALSLCDKVYLAEIFAARELNTTGVSSGDIASLMTNAEYIPAFDDISEKLKSDLKAGDLVITMGAGEAYKVARTLLS